VRQDVDRPALPFRNAHASLLRKKENPPSFSGHAPAFHLTTFSFEAKWNKK